MDNRIFLKNFLIYIHSVSNYVPHKYHVIPLSVLVKTWLPRLYHREILSHLFISKACIRGSCRQKFFLYRYFSFRFVIKFTKEKISSLGKSLIMCTAITWIHIMFVSYKKLLTFPFQQFSIVVKPRLPFLMILTGKNDWWYLGNTKSKQMQKSLVAIDFPFNSYFNSNKYRSFRFVYIKPEH